LRERPDDIPLLIEYFLKRFSAGAPIVVSPEAFEYLKAYAWPGNVRELQNAIERLVVLSHGDVIETEHLPAKFCAAPTKKKNRVVELPPEGYSLEALEREVVVQALERNDWNQTRAADFLQIPRHTLIYRMEKYDIKKN
jgi:two-component system NtrC family response regulator